MGIKLSVPAEVVEQYPEVFMDRMEIIQHWSPDHTSIPKYDLNFDYGQFRVVDGKRIRHPKHHDLWVHDYIHYSGGDPILLGAMYAIQQAMAVMIARQRQIDAEVV